MTNLFQNWTWLIDHDIQILSTGAEIKYSANHLLVNGVSEVLYSIYLKKLGTYLLLGDDMHINVKNSSESRYLKPATIRNVTRITRQGKDVLKKCYKSLCMRRKLLCKKFSSFDSIELRFPVSKCLILFFYPPCSISVLEWSLTRPEMPR